MENRKKNRGKTGTIFVRESSTYGKLKINPVIFARVLASNAQRV